MEPTKQDDLFGGLSDSLEESDSKKSSFSNTKSPKIWLLMDENMWLNLRNRKIDLNPKWQSLDTSIAMRS